MIWKHFKQLSTNDPGCKLYIILKHAWLSQQLLESFKNILFLNVVFDLLSVWWSDYSPTMNVCISTSDRSGLSLSLWGQNAWIKLRGHTPSNPAASLQTPHACAPLLLMINIINHTTVFSLLPAAKKAALHWPYTTWASLFVPEALGQSLWVFVFLQLQ